MKDKYQRRRGSNKYSCQRKIQTKQRRFSSIQNKWKKNTTMDNSHREKVATERAKYEKSGEEDHLSIPYLLLHLASLPRVPSKHQQSRGEPVQPVDCPKVLQTKLLEEKKHKTRGSTTSAVDLTFARMKTTVLCLYLPHGWTCRWIWSRLV